MPSRTSGAEGGPGKRNGSNPDTAPRPDPYIVGSASSAIGTLVERKTRFVMVVHLPRLPALSLGERGWSGRGAETVRDTLADTITVLPTELRRSLTWDQGSEMGRHAELKIAANIDIYFCDPHSPWQRGTNENTNGLLDWSLKVGL